jgi:hypothetical protein
MIYSGKEYKGLQRSSVIWDFCGIHTLQQMGTGENDESCATKSWNGRPSLFALGGWMQRMGG